MEKNKNILTIVLYTKKFLKKTILNNRKNRLIKLKKNNK